MCRCDIVLLDRALILLPSMNYFAPKPMQTERMRRLLAELTPKELAARAGSRFVRHDDIATGRTVRTFPYTFELTLRGSTTLRGRLLISSTDQVGDGLTTLVKLVTTR